MSNIHPLILCGGVGTRLWPLSRSQHPKQFQPINGDGVTTFFQATVQRHLHPRFANPVISVNTAYLDTARAQLGDLQAQAHLIAEPLARNTGPAVLAAALRMQQTDPDAILVVLPSDHVITGDLNAHILAMHKAAEDGLIVTFGIKPTYPETGYGYILDGGAYRKHRGLHRVEQFIEKPARERARALIETGTAYWASGISMFRADTLVEEYQQHDPVTYAAVDAALRNGVVGEDVTELAGEFFADAISEPTERAVFEHSQRIALAPCNVEWNDVGAWAAFHDVGEKSGEGNVASGDVLMIDTENSYVRGSKRLVAVVGMKDIIVVDTEDALLVTDRRHSQNVKKVVEALTRANRREVSEHVRHAASWGETTRLVDGNGFWLSLLTIEPGNVVALEQTPSHRRLLTVAEGELWLRRGIESHHFVAGQAVEVAPGQEASISNEIKVPLQVIEVCCETDDQHDMLRPMLETLVQQRTGARAYV